LAIGLAAESTDPDAVADRASLLNNLANRRSEIGDRTGALEAITEAVTLYRQLAATNPGAFTPNLAMSLNNLANQRSEIGDRTGALEAFAEFSDASPPSVQSAAWVARARWRRNQASNEPGFNADYWMDLATAVAHSTSIPDLSLLGHARRSIHHEAEASGLPSASAFEVNDLPRWSTTPLTETTLKLLRDWSSATWHDRADMLRHGPLHSVDERLVDQLEIASDLFPEANDPDAILALLRTAKDHGLETVLQSVLSQDAHRQLVIEWLRTESWEASATFVRQHPGFLDEQLTIDVLRTMSKNTIALQHISIVEAARRFGDGAVFDALIDPWVGGDQAMALLRAGDIDGLALFLRAVPAVVDLEFRGPLALAVVVGAAGPEHADQARMLVSAAIQQGNPEARRIGARRLRDLAWDDDDTARLFGELVQALEADTPEATGSGE
jgi:tetratricopeptide (TPR) repeat protein